MRAPPPDFRYVGLAIDDRGRVGRAVVPAATVIVAAGAALHGGVLEAACAGAATLAGSDLLRRLLDARRITGSLVIVPWGVLLSQAGDLRVLPWAAVKRVEVQVRHRRDEGTPLVADSTVTVETWRESFRGAARGALGLESLVVHVQRWASEASCDVAVDLGGAHPLEAEPAEPRFARLADAAAIIAARFGRADEDGVAQGYRGVSDADAWRSSWRRLRAILRSRDVSRADPRPLAALVAARLGAVGCVPDLLRLVSAPSGFLALVAKASALRLGAPLERAGGLEEVGAFVPPEDLADASLFAAGLD